MTFRCSCGMPANGNRHGKCALCCTQDSLFDAPRPGDARSADPLPSKKGAAANLVARQSQKRKILRRLLDGPVTSRSVADICGGQVSRASKRLGEMRVDGLIVACGYEYPPKGQGGVPATRYMLTDDGQRDAELIAGRVA